ncbi:hypothetical protein JQ597_28860 [Bradyrhizobium sp. AUGA SZCCT0177]|uniref:hypothetical protein n=1 Tax=Bradyrhizobium sp. AUGA SZCCT0177 TaxID=2807665 RepID=UPI001BAD0B39|nr:hypothetical protein [Bradyrhizobium sp. AUGA SZCCT0177]MBR1286069.1 hypothetical protein [Bradyrhizobium sp. AUGA SZCCT0177]
MKPGADITRRHRDQPGLFLELIEHLVMRDRPFVDADGSWGTLTVPPPGAGWRVADYSRERHTVWMRRRPVWVQPC